MADITWIGQAQAITQEDWIEVSDIEVGDEFTVTINAQDLTLEAESTSVNTLIDRFVLLINGGDAESPTIPTQVSDNVTASAFTQADGTYTLKLQARTSGVRYTLAVSSSNAAGHQVQVTETIKGSGARNEKQAVQLKGVPTGGTFTLRFDGQTTGTIAYNDSAANMQTALEGLSNIAPGDVSVTRTGSGTSGDPYIWTVEFTGNYATDDVPLMTGNGTNLTGAATITISTVTDGSLGTNEKQKIVFARLAGETDGGSCRFHVDELGVNTEWFYLGLDGPTALEIHLALQYDEFGSPLFASGDIEVTTLSGAPTGEYWFQVEFKGAYAATDMGQLSPEVTPWPNDTWDTPVVTTTQAGSSTPVNEVQRVVLNNSPTGGTFTLTFDDGSTQETTAAMAYNIDAATMQTELEALANIGAGNVTVAKSGWTYQVTFTSTLGGINHTQMTYANSLTGSGVDVETTQTATTGVSEIQTVTLTDSPTGGTFTLTFGANTTGALAYNATAATIQSALEGLASIGSGNITVSGAAGGPYVCTFAGSLAGTDVAMMSGTSSLTGTGSQSITATNITASTGPNYWSNVDNWSPAQVPVTGDKVYFESGSVSVLYDLDQNAVTLAELNFRSTYSGRVGSLDTEDARLDRELKIGATLLNIGVGRDQGAGSSLLRLNTGSVQTTLHIAATGLSEVEGLPAVQWRGSHASNSLTISRGEFGAAIYGGQTATLASAILGTAGDPALSDGELFVDFGRGLTVSGNLIQHGGELFCYCTIGGTLIQTGGIGHYFGAIDITGAVEISGGVAYWKSSGDLKSTADISAEGILDFSRDPRARDVAGVCSLHKGGTLLDPQRTVVWASPIRLYKCGIQDVTLDLGDDITLAVANV